MKAKAIPKVHVLGEHVCSITLGDDMYLQSYNTIVAHCNDRNVYTLDPKWEISRTTVGHVAAFLRDTLKGIRAKLDAGIYGIEHLNG
jgi:hypothetical protein